MRPSDAGIDREELRRAVADADLRVLLMSLYHLTGDEKWLADPYRPVRDVRLIADPSAGLSDTAQAEIRAAAEEVLAAGTPPVVTTLDDDRLRHLMETCLGESIDPMYVAMMREDMGFAPDTIGWDRPPAPEAVDAMSAVIVGSGVFGVAMAARLQELGLPYTVLEKNTDVGGTWFENRYPGCRVDTPNHFYSFSFAPNDSWSHYFSPRAEVFEYVRRCVDTLGIRPHIRFSTTLTGARWDDRRGRWRIEVQGPEGGEVLEAAVLISGIGQLNRPSIPAIPGLEDFGGALFHSARWPEDLDLAGKRVAVVGNGASGMQIVPAIADEVASLTVYQRSPQWARPVTQYQQAVPAGMNWLIRHVPFYATWNRFTLFWRYGDGLLPFIRKDPEWPHPERSLNRVNDRHRNELTEHIRAELAGREDLLDACIPTYPPYGKRILIDAGWYRTLVKPGVDLVTAGIERFTPTGIRTADGREREFDVVVMATGFVVTDLTARLGIVGRDGAALADRWAGENPSAYLGITVPEFPNLFLLYGPNTNLGHGGSLIFHAECQARYIAKLLVEMVERGAGSVECRQEVHDDYVARVDAAHAELIWTHPGMTTYYRNRFGRVISVSPWRLVDYWAMTHDPDLSDFELRHVSDDRVAPLAGSAT
jgi:4-hydroxyacetophenone monooxygenase